LRWWVAGVLSCLLVLVLLAAAGWFYPWYRARQQWHGAQSALAVDDLAAAATHLDRYLSERPDDAHAWFLAARTARRLERGADAERFLERCQQLGGVTEATRLEWDLLRVQRGDIGEIDVRLRQSIGPDHHDALLVLEALARGYIHSERLQDAIQACDLWIARQPEHPWPWLWRGTIYERLSHLDRALTDYQRAVENAPRDREARLVLGGLLLRQRQPSPAAQQYETILERTPDDSPVQVALAACRVEQGRAAEAIDLLDHVLEQSPEFPPALFLRGKVALQQDQPASAERWLRQATRLLPNDPEALYQLAQALRALRKEEEASRVRRRLDQLRKDYLRLDELTRLVARRSDDPQLRHEAGVVALRLGRSEEGLRWLLSLLRLKGDHRRTHALLADCYRQKGDSERAEYHRRLAEAP
jgi:tetratricopeptide (TPR) repeat protein